MEYMYIYIYIYVYTYVYIYIYIYIYIYSFVYIYKVCEDLLVEPHAFDGGLQGLEVWQASTFLRKRCLMLEA